MIDRSVEYIKIALICASLLFVLMMSACRSELPYTAKEVTATPYILAAGDVIDVSSPLAKDVEGQYVLNDEGEVDLPLIGRVRLSGLTITQSDALLTDLYGNGYLVNPDISLQLDAYRPFYILGEVENPGQYDYEDGLTLLNAVAIAGGFTYRADQEQFELVRTKTVEGGVVSDKDVIQSLGTIIHPGDTIYVKERYF